MVSAKIPKVIWDNEQFVDDYDHYEVLFEFVRECLGTNPSDPSIHDKHIIKKQRDLIMENRDVKNAVDRYNGAKDISEERRLKELDLLFKALERASGVEIMEDQKELVLAEGMKALDILIPELTKAGITVFFRHEDGTPMLGDHMAYGFMKAGGQAVCEKRNVGKKAKGETAERGIFLQTKAATCHKINTFVHVDEPFIHLTLPEGGEISLEQRSLRTGGKDPKVCLVTSEVIPVGTRGTFTFRVDKGCGITEKDLREIFAYGNTKGFGQWRNSGRGRFVSKITKIKK
jgi:hypothetical protein